MRQQKPNRVNVECLSGIDSRDAHLRRTSWELCCLPVIRGASTVFLLLKYSEAGWRRKNTYRLEGYPEPKEILDQ